MIGNGKKVTAKGSLPKAKNPKADAIHNGKTLAKLQKNLGGVVRATSYNYGMSGAKGRKLRGGPVDVEEGEE